MCRMVGRLLKEKEVAFIPVDAEIHEDLVKQYDIKSVPCLVAAEELGDDPIVVCRTPLSKEHLETFLEQVETLKRKEVE